MINTRFTYINYKKYKNGVIMPRPSKLTPEIQLKIGDGISLGLTYALAANSAGVSYQTLNQWVRRGQTEKSGNYYNFYKFIQKCNADAAKILLERLNLAAKTGDTGYVCSFWSEGFRKISAEEYIEKQTLSQRI